MKKIAYLYEPAHPAILRLIKMTIDNAHAKKRWVGTCGEMCSDPAMALLIMGLGIDEISVSPLVLPLVKKMIRSVKIKDAKKIAREAMKMKTAGPNSMVIPWTPTTAGISKERAMIAV